MTEVFSVTGEPIDLKEASIETLIACLHTNESERSILYERKRLIERAIAKKVGNETTFYTDDYNIRIEPRIQIGRRWG